jgi:hypothetical protein
MMKSITRFWLQGLEAGLPTEFDFGLLRTPEDASSFMFRLPNKDRGFAAKAIVDHVGRVHPDVAYRALIDAWDHDHGEVGKVFETSEALADAFRRVAPRSARRKPVRAWRGCSHPQGWYGFSWTLDRDCACWFALRFGSTPFVYYCEFEPEWILAEHNGRGEREIIADIEAIDAYGFVFLMKETVRSSRRRRSKLL